MFYYYIWYYYLPSALCLKLYYGFRKQNIFKCTYTWELSFFSNDLQYIWQNVKKNFDHNHFLYVSLSTQLILSK